MGKRLDDQSGKFGSAVYGAYHCRRSMQELIAQFQCLLRSNLERAANGAQAPLTLAYSVFFPVTDGFIETVVGGEDRDPANRILHLDQGEHITAAGLRAAINFDIATRFCVAQLGIRSQNLSNLWRQPLAILPPIDNR